MDRNGEPAESGDSCLVLVVVLVLCALTVVFELVWISVTRGG